MSIQKSYTVVSSDTDENIEVSLQHVGDSMYLNLVDEGDNSLFVRVNMVSDLVECLQTYISEGSAW